MKFNVNPMIKEFLEKCYPEKGKILECTLISYNTQSMEFEVFSRFEDGTVHFDNVILEL